MAGRPHTSRAPRRPGAPRTAAPGFAADSSRAFIPLVVFAVVAALFLVRLVYLQVIVAPSYAAQAEQARTVGFDIEPRRGTIYDRNGTVLAVSVDATTIYANPSEVEDLPGTAAALAGVLIACMTNSGSPAVGVDYTFNAMAAIVIGGTPFIGGKGGIGGTILGALLMKILASGLSLVGIPATWQKAITGFVIVALIIIDVVNDHRKNIKAQRRVYNNVG